MEWLAAARLAAREHAWKVGGAPPVVAAARRGEQPAEPLLVDLDATGDHGAMRRPGRPARHSPDVQTGLGDPSAAGLVRMRGDGLGESSGGMLRPGNAGSNTTAGHIDVFEACLAALPCLPEGVELVVRADTAGATHGFLSCLRQAKVGFSVGFAVTADVRDAIRASPDDAWTPATRQDGEPREGAAVAELTGQLDLSKYPDGSRVIARREPLHPGAQLTIEDIDGAGFTAFLTDRPEQDLAVLDVRHRAHAHVADRIRARLVTPARATCRATRSNATRCGCSWS